MKAARKVEALGGSLQAGSPSRSAKFTVNQTARPHFYLFDSSGFFFL